MFGSFIRNESVGNFSSHNYARLRKQLEEDGFFEKTDISDFNKLTKNTEFTSPSAAAVARNSSVNGRKEWKTQARITLDDFENKL